SNVKHVPNDVATIELTLRRCFEDKRFIERCKKVQPPYGDGHTGEKIAEILATYKLPPDLIHKKFQEVKERKQTRVITKKLTKKLTKRLTKTLTTRAK
ncbi:MAG: hypothetical protein L6Q71_01970, partial [Planctomycetes bacterium]|nr:hypothetical protein [Planctomycetota bacterium]